VEAPSGTSAPTQSLSDAAFLLLLEQGWENVRHIKNERIWFTNIYAIVSAAVLSFLHSASGLSILSVFLPGLLLALSTIGLLLSFRLKAELEDWLDKIEAMTHYVGLEDHISTGDLKGPFVRHIKFRWLFPVFYAFTTVSAGGLLAYQLFRTVAGG